MNKKVTKSSKSAINEPKKSNHKRSTTKWTREIALKAIQIEEQYYAKFNANHELIIRFPDPLISEDIVKGFSNSIKNVTFPFPIVPRECKIKLSEHSNVDKAIKEIEKIRFGGGRLQVKKNLSDQQKLNLSPEEIDPFTLYIGNLPHSKIAHLKNILKDANIQVGENKRKPKSYAFVTFPSFEDAIAGFKSCTKKFPPAQYVEIRFKRNKSKQVQDQSNDQPTATNSSPKDAENESPENPRRTSGRNRSKNGENETSKTMIAENGTEFDPNMKIKEEPTYLGFDRTPFNDMDGDTDCSETTFRFRSRSNSLDSNGVRKRRLSNDSSILAITDSEDEKEERKMKKPKRLNLPIELHGSMREIKDENSESTEDEIGDIGDLDYI